MESISGQLVDVWSQLIFPAKISFQDGRIVAIERIDNVPQHFILPGFIDAHVHIESSLLPPSRFGYLAARRGTVATVSDPHEIANVCGKEGVNWMIHDAQQSLIKHFFGAPSCVPATSFETAGAKLTLKDVEELMQLPSIYYLSEVMNFPGVLNREANLMGMIKAASALGKPVDGHAPGLKGEEAKRYIDAGIQTDHECFTLEEALDKLRYGMSVIIREGSAAKNFEALHTLIPQYSNQLMFCTDDSHPDRLQHAQIDVLVKESIALGYPLFDVLKIACVNPVLHYHLPVGLLRVGDSMDAIVVKDLKQFEVLHTYVDGSDVLTKACPNALPAINHFNLQFVAKAALEVSTDTMENTINVHCIVVKDGQLITSEEVVELPVVNGMIQGDVNQDVLKLVVLNRYASEAKPAVAFVKNMGLKAGAMASTVAHDSHNIIAVGADDNSIHAAIEALIQSKGGLSVVNANGEVDVLPLPIAGLMSDEEPAQVIEKYTHLDRQVKALGSTLHAPFMSLSFMALLVIPELKLSDKGLFKTSVFKMVDLIV
jgi:adenine deaminase